jgi:hypothetical protein
MKYFHKSLLTLCFYALILSNCVAKVPPTPKCSIVLPFESILKTQIDYTVTYQDETTADLIFNEKNYATDIIELNNGIHKGIKDLSIEFLQFKVNILDSQMPLDDKFIILQNFTEAPCKGQEITTLKIFSYLFPTVGGLGPFNYYDDIIANKNDLLHGKYKGIQISFKWVGKDGKTYQYYLPSFTVINQN